jgi:hypothetical protein
MYLEQWFPSPEQHKWVSEILGYDYEIIYTKGNEDAVVDVFSRKNEEERSPFSLLIPDFLGRCDNDGWLITQWFKSSNNSARTLTPL